MNKQPDNKMVIAPQLKEPKKKGVSWDIHNKIVGLRDQGLSYSEISIRTKQEEQPVSRNLANMQIREHEAKVCECYEKE